MVVYFCLNFSTYKRGYFDKKSKLFYSIFDTELAISYTNK